MKKIYSFILITFAFSWLLWTPKILLNQGLVLNNYLTGFFDFIFNLGAFGPLVAAFYLAYRNKGKLGVLNLLKRGVSLKFNKKWLFPILLLMPIITGGVFLVNFLLKNPLPNLELISNPWLLVYWFVYMFFLGGPLQEEFGWRGYALDKLQSNYTALKSSLILGVIWSVWHLPLNFTADVGPQYGVILSMFIGSLIAMTLLSIIFTWIYNNTNRSILAAMLFHTSLNFSSFKLFPVFESETSLPFYLFFIFITAVVILLIWGPKKLTRNDLN